MGWEDEENYVKKQHLLEYVRRDELDNYAKKYEIPDHRIYALKEDIDKYYLKKRDLPKLPDLSKFATKDEIPKIPDHSMYAFKEDIPDVSDLAKRSELPNLDGYLKKNELPAEKDLSEYAKKEDIPKIPDHSIYALKKDIPKDYLTKKDLPKPPDLSKFVTKDQIPKILDLTAYLKKVDIEFPETSYCFVKLENNARLYDGETHDHEIYAGSRGTWKVKHDTHKKISTADYSYNYEYFTPFEGIFFIDFCMRVQRDTHILKPFVIQRIRTSVTEVLNLEYFDNSTAISGFGNDVTHRTFIKTASLWLPENASIKFSIQFSNRSHNNRKQWLHAIGSSTNESPSYFSITGTRMINKAIVG